MTEEQMNGMTNAELFKIYSDLKKRHYRLASIPVILLLPAALYFGFIGWGGSLVFMMSGLKIFDAILNVFGIFNFLAFSAYGVCLATEGRKAHKISLAAFCVYNIVALIVGIFSAFNAAMLVYAVYLYFEVGSMIEKKKTMRKSDRYPFLEREEAKKRQDEYIKQLAEEVKEEPPKEYTREEIDEKLLTLPEKHQDQIYKTQRDDIDETDNTYTDKLSGGRRRFEENARKGIFDDEYFRRKKKTDARKNTDAPLRPFCDIRRSVIENDLDSQDYDTFDEIDLSYCGDLTKKLEQNENV